MNDKLYFGDLFRSSRGQVYLLWAFLTGAGFTATHYYQSPNINIVWTIISIIGLGFMYKVMPLSVSQMKKIYTAWLIPITVGIAISVLAARTSIFPELVGYLGPVWLIIMSVGYFWNGLVDAPALWYYIAVALNIAAAFFILLFDSLLPVQYLITAVISSWAMLNLWIFRTDY